MTSLAPAITTHTNEKLSTLPTIESYAVPSRITVSYQDFDITKFKIEDPIVMLTPRGDGKYIRCIMTYDGHPFALKGPALRIHHVNHDGSSEGKISGLFMAFPRLQIVSHNNQKFIQVIESIYQAMISYLERHKNSRKFPEHIDIAYGCVCKSPLWRGVDFATGKLGDPYMGFKVRARTEYNCLQEATFLKSTINGREIDHDDLRSHMMVEEPEISLSGYIGCGKASIPMRLLRGNIAL